MEPRRAEAPHDAVRELLGAYALGAVAPEERQRIEAHLADCPACRAELAELRSATSALPLTVPERVPSPALRNRLIAQVQAEAGPPSAHLFPDAAPAARPEPPPASPYVQQAPVPLNLTPLRRRPHMPRATTVWAAAAILLLVFAAAMVVWNLDLRHRLDTQVTPTQTVAVQLAQPASGARASLIYLPDQQVMLLNVNGMPQLPSGEVYQVWLIDANGPVPVGTFHPGNAQIAIAANPVAYQALAVTTEPGPLGSPKPTGAKVITASLGSRPA